MPANIYSYVGRQAAWHKLGLVTGHYLTWQEILDAGHLNFEVEKLQLLDPFGRPIDAYGTFRLDESTGEYVFLGPVGADYTVIQHATGFELVDALMASQHGAHYENAGALGHGANIWRLADLNLTLSVGDDHSIAYLLFTTSHDATLSYQFRLCLTRVVCQNTLNRALSEKSRACFRVR